MQDVIIRDMEEADVPFVAAIEKQIFSRPWSGNSFLDALHSESNIYLAAYLRHELIGYCGFWLSYDTADLCNLAVAEPYRGIGIGRKLLREGICRVKKRDAARIMLEVRSSNKEAVRLYLKENFNRIGIRKQYYSHPTEDALLMEKLL